MAHITPNLWKPESLDSDHREGLREPPASLGGPERRPTLQMRLGFRDDAWALGLEFRALGFRMQGLGTYYELQPRFPRTLVDMGSLLETLFGTVLNYKRDPYVHH